MSGTVGRGRRDRLDPRSTLRPPPEQSDDDRGFRTHRQGLVRGACCQRQFSRDVRLFAFGRYAGAIGEAFFPAGSGGAQFMSAFMTFGAGLLMRPLGAVVLGVYIDHRGRRAAALRRREHLPDRDDRDPRAAAVWLMLATGCGLAAAVFGPTVDPTVPATEATARRASPEAEGRENRIRCRLALADRGVHYAQALGSRGPRT